MPKLNDVLYAGFEPSYSHLLKTISHNGSLSKEPVLAVSLSKIFPYLLLLDSMLEVVTWTNGDPYQNFLISVTFTMIVMYWQLILHFFLPMLLAITFSCLVWSVSSVVYDSKSDEEPTIGEVIDTIHNITVRCEIFFRPARHIRMKRLNFAIALMVMAVLTPVHVFLVTSVLGYQNLVWILGLFLLTFHSPWSFSIRRLIWRSSFVRLLTLTLTGVNYNESPKSQVNSVGTSTTGDTKSKAEFQLLTDFEVINVKEVSQFVLEQEVVFPVIENERRWIGLGWSGYMYSSDPPNFVSAISNLPCSNIHKDFSLPKFENDLYTYTLEWLDNDWKIDLSHNHHNSLEGWVYYDRHWENKSFADGFLKFTRSRKWVRRAKLTTDKSKY